MKIRKILYSLSAIIISLFLLSLVKKVNNEKFIKKEDVTVVLNAIGTEVRDLFQLYAHLDRKRTIDRST